MITIKMWKDILWEICREPVDFMFGVRNNDYDSIRYCTISIEIIAFIIYKISGWED